MKYNHKDTVQRKQRLSYTYGESASTLHKQKMIYICMYTVYCQKSSCYKWHINQQNEGSKLIQEHKHLNPNKSKYTVIFNVSFKAKCLIPEYFFLCNSFCCLPPLIIQLKLVCVQQEQHVFRRFKKLLLATIDAFCSTGQGVSPWICSLKHPISKIQITQMLLSGREN